MIHMGDNISLREPNLIQDSYPNKECPDCGEPIPEDLQEGQDCRNCGHIFCLEKKDD